MSMNRPWAAWQAQENDLLLALYPCALKAQVLAALPGRSWNAIICHARTLRLRRINRWPPESAEDARAREKRHRAKHRESIRRTNRRYRIRNRELDMARKRAWREANPERANRATAAWRARNPGATSLAKHHRAALEAGIRSDFTLTQWKAMKAMHEYRCAYCHEEKPLTQDHIIPISKGGAHTRINIAPACRSCNSSKRDRDLLEWLASRIQSYA